VDRYKDELMKIRSILRVNHRGLTTGEISKELDINRNSVAKYMDVLLTLGYVELKRIGPAKMYSLSDRVKLSTMLNFSNDCIIVFDREFKIIQINDAALVLTNSKHEDVIGRSISDVIIASNTHSEFYQTVQTLIEGEVEKFEYMFDFNGEEKYYYMKFIPTTFDTGEPGLTLILEDMSQRKKTEKLIKESEEQFNTLFNALDVGVLLIDINGKPIMMNSEAERIFEMNLNETMNHRRSGKYFQRIRIDGTTMSFEELAGPRARNEKKRVDGILMGLKKEEDNISWLNVSAEPVLNEDNEVERIICFYEDITKKLNGAHIFGKKN